MQRLCNTKSCCCDDVDVVEASAQEFTPGLLAPVPEKTAKDMLEHEKAFYMNFKVLNLKEAFPKIMTEKLKEGGAGKLKLKFAEKGAGFIAGNPKFGKMFASKIATKLTENMPAGMAEKGIMCNMTVVHQCPTGFVVMRVNIHDVDLNKFLDQMKDKLGAEKVEQIRPLVGKASRFVDIPSKIVPVMQGKMIEALEVNLPKGMEEKAGFKVLLINKPSLEQAEFFFDSVSEHHFDVILRVLNLAEATKALVDKKVDQKLSGGPLRRGLGKIAKAVGERRAPIVFSRKAGTVMEHGLIEFMEDAGVGLNVMQHFRTGEGGVVVLRCSIPAMLVDLPQLVEKMGGVLKVSADQHFLRLGHEGKDQIYHHIRTYISKGIPLRIAQRTDNIMKVEVEVKDVSDANIHPEMEDADDEEQGEQDE